MSRRKRCHNNDGTHKRHSVSSHWKQRTHDTAHNKHNSKCDLCKPCIHFRLLLHNHRSDRKEPRIPNHWLGALAKLPTITVQIGVRVRAKTSQFPYIVSDLEVQQMVVEIKEY